MKQHGISAWRLKTKIRLALFLVSFMPFVLVVVYLQKTGKTRIIDDAVKQYSVQVHQVAASVSQETEGMKKELRFLASLDLMNDMLVGDVDKRIARLLQHKCRDLGAGVSMYALGMQGNMVAQSGTAPLPKSKIEEMIAHLEHARASYRDFFFMGKTLYLFTPLNATMQKHAPVGNLLLAYDLTRLKRFTPQSAEGSFLFYFPESGLHIGNEQAAMDTLNLALRTPKQSYIGKQFIIVKERLGSVLSEGWVLEAVETSHALAFIERFMMFVWLTLIGGTIVIVVVSWWIGERLLKPVEALSDTTRKIVETRDYTTRVAVYPESEMQALATHFNTLLETVNSSMHALEEESRMRLARFVRLITIFNELIQTQTPEACIGVVTKEMDRLVEGEHFGFSTEMIDNEATDMPLYVTDHTNHTRRYYGKLVCEGEAVSLDENTLKFYRAVASMVMLQLDRIEMIREISAVSEAKSAFISYMSHELRTPLHAILGTTQYLIRYETLTPQQQEKVGKIETSAGHLLSMINAMLDLAQIEAGKVEVNPEVCNGAEIDQIIDEAVEITGVLAEQKALSLTKEEAPACSGIYVDKKYVKQIVLNLLSNAIKYTQKGSISLSYRCEETALYVTVTDTGTGLSKEDIAAVFDAYKQLRNRHEEMGNGLGLAISRKLAQLFDADVRLESEGRGKGVRATIILRRQ